MRLKKYMRKKGTDTGCGSITDRTLCSLSDNELKRVIGSISINDLELAMNVLSGKVRRSIMDTLPERQALIVVEDMDFIGPIRLVDIAESVEKIFNAILSNISAGEIATDDEGALKFFRDLFQESKKEAENRKKLEAEHNLKGLLMEYETGKNKTVSWK